MDRAYVERNRAQTERLKGLRRLSYVELGHPVGEHWTVAVALAHLGYWDGRALGAIEAWRRYGTRLEFWGGVETVVQGIRLDEAVVNDLRLGVWRTIPPRDALEQAIRAAEALDQVVADPTPAEAEVVASQRYRVLDRSLHRSEHLDEIEQALRS